MTEGTTGPVMLPVMGHIQQLLAIPFTAMADQSNFYSQSTYHFFE